jgi:hypothetical protein
MRHVCRRRVAKKHFCRVLDQFLCICAPNCPFERRKREAVSNSGTRRDDETKIDLASIGGFVGATAIMPTGLAQTSDILCFQKLDPCSRNFGRSRT